VVFLIGEQLLGHQLGVARIEYDKLGEVQNFFQTLLGDFQHLTDTGRCALKVPDVGNRSSQFDVPHTFTANLGTGNFYAAAVADLSLKTDLLELAAVALPVLGRSEDTLTVQTVAFRLLGTVVDRFRTLNCTVRPFPDTIRRSKTNLDRFKSVKFQTVTSYISTRKQEKRTEPAVRCLSVGVYIKIAQRRVFLRITADHRRLCRQSFHRC